MALELSEHVFVASMVAWTLASAGVLHRLSWPAEHPNSALASGHHFVLLMIATASSPRFSFSSTTACVITAVSR